MRPDTADEEERCDVDTGKGIISLTLDMGVRAATAEPLLRAVCPPISLVIISGGIPARQ